jgi:hypothetical protein
MLASGAGSEGLFYTLLVLHVAAALTGFGSIGFAGTYAARAAQLVAPAGRRAAGSGAPPPGPPAAPAGMTTEELVRYFRRPAALWWALLAVPWLGLGALAADPHGGGVVQAWALGAFALWGGAAVVAGTRVVPALGRIGSTLVRSAGAVEPGALDGAARARVARWGQVASRGAALCDVLFFLALALMIWQP